MDQFDHENESGCLVGQEQDHGHDHENDHDQFECVRQFHKDELARQIQKFVIMTTINGNTSK